METRSLRQVVTARLLRLLSEGENEQAIVAASRALLEAAGVLGAKGTALDEGEQRRAVDMSPDEIRRELARQSGVAISPPGRGKSVQ
jgi:hypothetical protein